MHFGRLLDSGSQLELIFDRKSNYIRPCLLVENVKVLVAQREAER